MNSKENEEPRTTIAFQLNDEYGNIFKSSSSLNVCEDIGYTELDALFEKFDNFLMQVGYQRPGGCVFEKSITEKEYDAIDQFLDSYRENKRCFSAEWIPVSDWLPYASGDYLVTFGGPDAFVTVSHYDAERKLFDTSSCQDWRAFGVTAWTRLPDPFQAEQKEKREDENDRR